MGNPRDDMVITPRLKRRSDRTTRERAAEERRNRRTVKKKRGIRARSIRGALAARRLRGAGGRRTVGKAASRGARAAKAAGRGLKAAARALGYAVVVAEAAVIASEGVRRARGASRRLIAAQDAHTILGTLDEEAAGASVSRGFMEGNRRVLEIIGHQGKVNSQIASVMNDMKKMATDQAIGADLIERDPFFDSKDSLMDKLVNRMIKRATRVGLKHLSRKAAAKAILKRRFRHVKSGR